MPRTLSNEELHQYELDGACLTIAATTVLLGTATAPEDLLVVRKYDDSLYHGEGGNDVFVVERLMSDHKDDIFSLLDIVLETRRTDNSSWTLLVQKEVLRKLLPRCTNLFSLMLLYRALPGADNVFLDDVHNEDTGTCSYQMHRIVFLRMIEVCGNDVRKLFLLLKHLGDVDGFARSILKRINAIAETEAKQKPKKKGA